MIIRVRAAAAGDYERICELMDTVDSLHFDRLPDIYRRPAEPARTRSWFESVLRDRNQCLRVAEIDGRAAGYIHGTIRETPPDPVLVPRRFAKLDGMGVDERYRRRGTGRMLLDALRRWAEECGADSLELNVHDFNRGAMEFYRAEGFDDFRHLMKKPLR